MKEKSMYYKRLDLLRLISCAMILLYHLNIVQGGFLAVCTFFTLSGYLGCMSALKANNFSIKKYYFSRLKKIYLPLVIVVFLTVILAKICSFVSWINLKPETMSVLFGYNNYWQLNANMDYFIRHVSSPFMSFWYISIFMQYELLFPIIFLLFRKCSEKIGKHFSLVAVLLMLISSTAYLFYLHKTQDIMVFYYNSFARSFSVLFGVLLAILQIKYGLRLPKPLVKIEKLIYVFYLLLFVAMCLFIPDKPSLYAIEMLIITFITFRIISYSTFRGSKDEKNKIIEFFSKSSYEIYLVQYPIIFFAQYIIEENVTKNVVIICSTLIIALLLHIILNHLSKNKVGKYVVAILIGAVILCGSFIVIKEKDHSDEMKELETILNENLIAMEEKNTEYLKQSIIEQESWNEVIKGLDNDESKISEIVTNLPVVGIGDSVLLAASPGLYKRFPNGYFDGKVSRTIVGGRELLSELIEEGKVGNTLILALANNGDYIEKRNKDLMEVVGDREVYWVNAVKADIPEFNDSFKQFAENYPNLHIVDWEGASKEHPEYFYGDGIHVKGDGIGAYADLVYEAIYNDYLEDFNAHKNQLIAEHNKELMKKVGFYGNDALINSFGIIDDKYKDVSYSANQETTFDDLYSSIEKKYNENTLEYKIILLFDKSTEISEEEYARLVNSCDGHIFYICNLVSDNFFLKAENVKILDFTAKIKEDEEFLMPDKVHLSQKGSEIVADTVFKAIEE